MLEGTCYYYSELKGYTIKNPRFKLNHEIKAPTVRLMGADGSQLGVMTLSEALNKAHEEGYDLAEVSPAASPPVVKLLDWGKYQYEQEKLRQKSRKKQKTIEIKQIRMGLKIGEHDIEVKRRAARKFLEAGNKVKITARFKGREMTHQELGKKVLDVFFSGLSDIATIESTPSMAGRDMSMVVGLSKAEKSKAANTPSAGESTPPSEAKLDQKPEEKQPEVKKEK